MKKCFCAILATTLLFGGCTASPAPVDTPPASTVTPAASAPASSSEPTAPPRVVALSSSLAEIWLLAGGELVGVTSDALEGRDLGLPADIQVIGTITEPNAEAVVALEPDLVILTPDLEGHLKLRELLTQSNIETYTAKVEKPAEYLQVLGDFCARTGRDDLYQQNGVAVRAEIDALLAQLPEADTPPTALFLRAFSSGVKVKARDHVVCDILDEIGVVNVAAGNPALEELSMEAIVQADPDYIFVITMGKDEAKALTALEDTLGNNPAWATLSAVQNDRLIVLPRELFHYKPNNRWGESYAYLLKIILPEIYGENQDAAA